MLLKNPGSTLIAMLALTLAIGANTAIFSVVDGVLLRPLRYGNPQRLAFLWETNLSKGIHEFDVTAPDYRDWKGLQRSFDAVAAFRAQPSILSGRGIPERIDTALVSPGIFELLGAGVWLGRPFQAAEDVPGRNRVVVLSQGLWQRRFGGDAAVLGKALTLDGNDYIVVGVTAPGFRLPDTPAEMWLPFTLDAKELLERGDKDPAHASRSALHTLKVIGRLKPGVSVERARAEMQSIARGLEGEYPDTNAGWSANVVRMDEQMVGDIRPTLWTLLGAVGFVLLIACMNVANLLLAQSRARQKEIAVRLTLGAGPWRIVRQLLTGSLLLSLISGLLGLALAYWGVRALVALSPANLPRLDEVSVDGRVLLFTLLVSILTGALFGAGPAILAARNRLNEVLKAAGRSSMASVRTRRLGRTLVVAEVALSVVLLTGAALTIRSFAELQSVDPGFRPDHLLTMRLALPESRYDGTKVGQFYSRLIDRVRNVPGVLLTGVARDLPMSGSDPSLNFIVEHRPALASSDQPRAKYRAVSADYFAAMGIPLIKGRYFTASDAAHSPTVAIVNETMAQRYFPNEEPLGRRIQSGFEGSPWCSIVGVIGNVKHAGLDAEANPEMYYPYLQVPPAFMSFVEGSMTLLVRTGAEPAPMARAIAGQVQALDPEEAVFQVATMQDLVQGSVAQPRFRAFLLGIFALVALVLAVTGLYGLVSYSVSQRANELGVRVALGAQKSDLLGLVLGEGARLALTGVVAGVVLALALSRTLSKLLYAVKPNDPLTFVAIPALLLAVALLASYVPARRATRADPTVALRQE